ncbi:MAG: gamma carbonic anhydrase family protein, partial [Acinetobacter sp.]
MLYKFQGHIPTATHQPWDGWVAPTATVIGQV